MTFFPGFIVGAATALLLEFLLESWRDWRWRRETKLLNDLERDWIEPIGPDNETNNETTT